MTGGGAVAGVRAGAVAADLLLAGCAVSLAPRGASMEPFIRDGEEVRVEPLRGLPRLGEVALARVAGGGVVLHRVVGRTAAGLLVLRGDAQETADAPVARADVLGRAVAVGGRRRLHLRPVFGRLVIAGLALRRSRLVAGPLRPLARGLRSLGARA